MAGKSMRDRIREQAQTATSEGAGYLKLTKSIKFFNPKEGEFELDVIPYENADGDLEPFRKFKCHSGIGAEDKKYVCPTTFAKPCPICDERKKMAKSANSDPELIKALNPKDRILMFVIDLTDKKNDSVQLWDASYHAFVKDLLKAIDTAENSMSKRKRSLPHAGFAELAGGQTLLVTIEESPKIKKFYQATRIDAADRDDYEEAILDETFNLDECFKVLSYDELEAIFLELDPEDQGSNRTRQEKKEEKAPSRRRGHDVEEEEAPAPSRRRSNKEELMESPTPTRRRATTPEPEEEAPVVTRRRSAAPPKEEEAVETDPSATVAIRRRGANPKPEEVVEEAPVRRRGARPEPVAPAGKCWVKGGVFGVDCDTYTADAPEPNCYDCPEDTWKACKEAQIKL